MKTHIHKLHRESKGEKRKMCARQENGLKQCSYSDAQVH